jgi:hypothetical protein
MRSLPAQELRMNLQACRALADDLGTAGQALHTLGRGGAIADALNTGLPGATTPDAYHTAARSTDRALTAVGTALLELGGAVVAAIITATDRDTTTVRQITDAARNIR